MQNIFILSIIIQKKNNFFVLTKEIKIIFF